MEIRIYYEDTDCGGVVYYANYLKYFERARTRYLEERGLSVAELRDGGTQFMVVHAELDYRSPARYGDTLTIDTSLAAVGQASLTFAHVMRERTSGRVVVEGSAKLVTVDDNLKVKRLDKPTSGCATRTSRHEELMDKLGTWLAVTGVAIGFVVLAWLLFSDNPADKKKKKP
jgi:acyl-CoA thioester hydrolase